MGLPNLGYVSPVACCWHAVPGLLEMAGSSKAVGGAALEAILGGRACSTLRRGDAFGSMATAVAAVQRDVFRLFYVVKP
jgi:hypothetical protein